ncbi:CDP-glycerol glycerophosphotransferase [Sinosporangium album]|uniref:CDP-glycerol glycerophosphotransferase n=1 Tax=Sinosporangium album TaxID=504805 RepID=A0A1G8CZ34_9ACTN|nr:bifunctional glycosyltransferase/CDP-glycerol:glycerophosphate glycerophosphotransferase [Sinosporangium album]SDH50662.1 CDP-glycerol glycerophosphotransferase [Sinosporangium album]
MAPLLSVVVPYYNVEPYFEECLASLAAQTLKDVEFILVDDGSVDASAVIAKNRVDKDPRFRIVEQENQGLGRARNTGTAHATGTYLAFADSDDVLPRTAYETLVTSLERTGSDISCGGVRRLSSAGITKSWSHVEPFRATRKKTHVRDFTALLQDRTVWNKVYRRTFWDAHGFEFPGGLYEDSPVTVAAHVLARSVDVLRNVVYYWRIREDGDRSITQRARELPNIVHRMAAVRTVGRFLASNAPQLKPLYDRYMLDVDLNLVVNAMGSVSADERRELLNLADAYLADIDPEVFEGLASIRRLKFHLARRRMVPELLEVLDYEANRSGSARVKSVGLFRPKWFVEHPFFRDRSRGVPDSVYEFSREMVLHSRVEDVTPCPGGLTLNGRAYIKGLNAASADQTKIRLWLSDRATGAVVELPVTRTLRPEITADAGDAAHIYDWAGFQTSVRFSSLRTGRRWRRSAWELHVEVTGRGVARTGRVAGPWHAYRRLFPGHEIVPRVVVQPVCSEDNLFLLQVNEARAMVTAAEVDGDALELRGWLKKPTPGASLSLVRRRARDRIDIPVELVAHIGKSSEFRARVPLADLPCTGPAAPGRQTVPAGDGVLWDFWMVGTGKRKRVMVEGGLALPRHADGVREAALTRTLSGCLSLVERAPRPVVGQAHWTDDDRLVLRGDVAVDGWRPERMSLRRRRTGDSYEAAVRFRSEDGGFTAEFAPAAMPGPGGELPLGRGLWDLLVEGPDGEVPVVVDRAAFPLLPAPRVAGHHEYTLGTHQADAAHLRVRHALGHDERGARARAVLRDSVYPRLRREPLRDLVVFDSYAGSQFSCNPRAVFEALRERAPHLAAVWVTKDGQFAVPPGTRTVLAGSRDHYEAMARARYVVGNFGQQRWFDKRPGQTYLQTWHGTPLKLMGYDLSARPYRRTEKLDWMRAEVPKWDLLISPSPFATPLMRSAFGYQGEILEVGYPRNDVFFREDAAERARRTRRRLGVPEGGRVVLYAPTWRDDRYVAAGKCLFDLELDLARLHAVLGDGVTVLVRAHYLVTQRRRQALPPSAIDVSRFPDIADLHLASDVLVTDYSSAMFDFANTRRPIVFFTYDLERYRDEVRGFYFDLEECAPGPVVRTSDEVIDVLRDLDAVAGRYGDAYTAFRERFCPHDDGGASGRVVGHLLGR